MVIVCKTDGTTRGDYSQGKQLHQYLLSMVSLEIFDAAALLGYELKITISAKYCILSNVTYC